MNACPEDPTKPLSLEMHQNRPPQHDSSMQAAAIAGGLDGAIGVISLGPSPGLGQRSLFIQQPPEPLVLPDDSYQSKWWLLFSSNTLGQKKSLPRGSTVLHTPAQTPCWIYSHKVMHAIYHQSSGPPHHTPTPL